MANLNRALPITKDEFQDAVNVIRATSPDQMLRYLLGDEALADSAGIAARKLRSQSAAAKVRNALRSTAKINEAQ